MVPTYSHLKGVIPHANVDVEQTFKLDPIASMTDYWSHNTIMIEVLRM